jgi:DNA-binding winged helix-turn-helix (wHTH) protein/tetratricopeptide (TPR) repeat protein
VSAEHKLLRFGVFELDLTTEELRNSGTLVKLPPQAFKLLALLASRSGEIVSRDEIQRLLWGDETFVDFDKGVNKCILLIRNALNDKPERPLYVATIPRRGYRFLAPVKSKTIEISPAVAESGPGTTPSLVLNVDVDDAILDHSPVPARELNPVLPSKFVATIDRALEKDRELRYQTAAAVRVDFETFKHGLGPLAPKPVGPEPPHPRPWKRWQLAAALLLCTAIIAGGIYWYLHETPKLTEKDTIVVADFNNQSTDPVFGDALTRALQVELKQTPFLNVLAPDKARGTLELLKRDPHETLTPDLARDVCLRSHSKAVISGSIADSGNGYRIELAASDCQTGKTVASAAMESAGRSGVVHALGIVGAELRRKLGESKGTLQKFNKPLDEATSASPEALQALAQAAKMKAQHGDAAVATSYLSRAVDLDPNFAQAYLNLGIGYFNAHELGLAAQNSKKAYDLRDRVTERDRIAIEAFYYNQAGQVGKSIAAFTEQTRTFPKDPIGYMNLSAALLPIGDYKKAGEAAQESLRLDPSAASYVNLMQSLVSRDLREEAKSIFDQAQAHKVDDGWLYMQRYILAFLLGDRPAMEQQVMWASGKPHWEDAFLCAESHTEAFYGRILKSRALSERAIESAKHAKSLQGAAECKANQALLEAEVGSFAEARRQAAAALTLSPTRSVLAVAALALARAGDLEQAEKLSDKLNEQYPEDTMVQGYLLATIRSAVEVQRNNPGLAHDILNASIPYEQGFDAFGALYPAYVRGNAFLKSGQAQQASAEFQKMIDHPGIMQNFVTAPLAHLQLGRAQAMMGDKAAARKSYQDFLTLWKDTDPGIPIYKQAKAEYAKLR